MLGTGKYHCKIKMSLPVRRSQPLSRTANPKDQLGQGARSSLKLNTACPPQTNVIQLFIAGADLAEIDAKERASGKVH